MSLTELFAIAVAAISLWNSWKARKESGKDRQSQASRQELDSLKRDIERLRHRVGQLEQENEALTDENLRLHRKVFRCPAPDCPLLDTPWVGPERRSKPRPPKDE